MSTSSRRSKRSETREYSDEGTEEEYIRNGGFSFRMVFTWILIFYLLIMTVVILPTLVLIGYFLVVVPLEYINPPLSCLCSHFLARIMNFQFVLCARLGGINVDVYGDSLENAKYERSLVLPNHLGLIDHFLFMTATDHYGSDLVGRWIFIIFNVWKKSPLGYLWHVYGNYFIDTVHPSKREEQLAHLSEHFKENYHRKDLRWVVLYPEGSRLFLIKKKNVEFEKKFNLPKLNHCAYPRLGAALTVLKTLGPSQENNELANCGKGEPLKYLVDVTLGYPNGEVFTIDQVFTQTWVVGEPRQFAVNFKVFEIDPKWSEEENLKRFLFERAQEKDRLLDEFYKTGKFPGEAKPSIIPSDSTMFIFQIVILTLFYFVYRVFISILSKIF